MNVLIKAVVALFPVIAAEIFLRYLMGRDTDREILDAGTFKGSDATIAAGLIAKRRHRIAASFMLSYSLIVTGTFAIMRNPVTEIKILRVDSFDYGLLGISAGPIFVILTWLFARYIRSINFRREKPQGYWKSYLTGPIRTVAYTYNTLWLISA